MLSKGSARTVGLCKTMKSSKDIFLCFSMINVTKDDPRSDKTSWISVAPTSHLSLSLETLLDSHPTRLSSTQMFGQNVFVKLSALDDFFFFSLIAHQAMDLKIIKEMRCICPVSIFSLTLLYTDRWKQNT